MVKVKLNKITLKGAIIGIVTFFCVTMFVFSFNWERYHPEHESHEALYYSIIKKRNADQKTNRIKLKEKEISIDEFFVIDEQISKNTEDQLKSWHKKSRKIKADHKFLGRSNFKFWFDQYFKEFRALFFMVLLLYLYKSYRLPSYVLWASLLGIATSIFVHYFLIFKTAADFYDSTYIIAESLLSLLAAFLIVSIIQWLAWKQSILVTVRELFSFVYEEAEEEGYYNEDKKNEIRKRRVEITNKAVGIKDDN